VSVAMKKIDGISDAEVSLSKGTATIQLNPGNQVRLEQIRKAVEDSGVTPKEATIKMRGELGFESGHFTVKVLATNESFDVDAIPSTPDKSEQALKQFIGQELNFVVFIPPAKGKTQRGVTIKDFWK
jgi:copper chaperone CopZ